MGRRFYKQLIALADARFEARLVTRTATNKEHPRGKKLDHLLEQLPAKRRAAIEARTGELATLKNLRRAVAQTQQNIAVAPGVGQDTIPLGRIK